MIKIKTRLAYHKERDEIWPMIKREIRLDL